MNPQVIGVGLAVLDHLMVVPDFPNREGVFPSAQYEVQGGGMVATALVTAQKLGATTEFWGRVGDDEVGHALLKELKGYNVNTSQVHIVPQGKSGVCFVMVKADTGERAFVVSAQKNLYVDLKNLNLDRIRKAKVLLIDASWSEAAQQAAHFARSHSIPVIVDIHEPSQPSLDLLSLADYAIIPRQLADVLTSKKGDYSKVLHKLKARGVKVPIVTLGSEGCTFLHQEKIFRLPAFKVKVVDTTGAGDCFHGAFCFALVRDFAVPEAIGFASAVAAMCCMRLGGRSGIPTYEQAIDFMREQAAQV
jgi:sugar/nucleoside kinase (ribokinase family)